MSGVTYRLDFVTTLRGRKPGAFVVREAQALPRVGECIDFNGEVYDVVAVFHAVLGDGNDLRADELVVRVR